MAKLKSFLSKYPYIKLPLLLCCVVFLLFPFWGALSMVLLLMLPKLFEGDLCKTICNILTILLCAGISIWLFSVIIEVVTDMSISVWWKEITAIGDTAPQ